MCSVQGFIILTGFSVLMGTVLIGLYAMYGQWRELRHAKKQQQNLFK